MDRQLGTKYALVLNDMRAPNVENIRSVRFSDNRQELVDWYNSLLIEPYTDGRWLKVFIKDSELEWFNPVSNLTDTNGYWGGIWTVPVGVEPFQLTKQR